MIDGVNRDSNCCNLCVLSVLADICTEPWVNALDFDLLAIIPACCNDGVRIVVKQVRAAIAGLIQPVLVMIFVVPQNLNSSHQVGVIINNNLREICIAAGF